MFDNYIIEIRPPSMGVTFQAGIVVRDGGSFRFFAASRAFDALEGQRFNNPKTAEQAALRCIAGMLARKAGARATAIAPAGQFVGPGEHDGEYDGKYDAEPPAA